MTQMRAVDPFVGLIAALALAAVCLKNGRAEADRGPMRGPVTNRQLLHGWTFTLEPREASPSPDDSADTPASMADIRAIAFEPQATLFGGVLRGPFAIGNQVLPTSAGPRGFVARLRRSGRSELIRQWEGQSPAVTALFSTATGRILVGSADGGLWEMTSSGRVLWSLPNLAAPAGIATLEDGNVVTGGCEHWNEPPVLPGAPPQERIGRGYIARVTPDGKLKWRFTFGDDGASTSPKTCVTGVALGPAGDIFAVVC